MRNVRRLAPLAVCDNAGLIHQDVELAPGNLGYGIEGTFVMLRPGRRSN